MLGDNIKKLRILNKLTQKELAEVSGITRESVGNYERGDRIPPADTLNNIATALGCSLMDLLEDQVVNISDMGREQKETYIDLLIDYPKFKELAKFIEEQGYSISQEVKGTDIILSKNNEIIAKIPEGDFTELGDTVLKHIKEFVEFEIYKLVEAYKLLT